MIIQFSIANYRSFNKLQSLNFRATGLVSQDKSVDDNNIVIIEDSEYLRIVGLYGANGSGKSNLIEGLRVFKGMIVDSLEIDELSFFTLNPFMFSSKKMENAGYFQITVLLSGKKYRYGFTLEANGNIQSEWLFGPADKKETYYFKRVGSEITSNPDWFKEGLNLPYDKLKPDTLFLTFCTSYDGEISRRIRDYFKNNMSFEGKTRYPSVLTDQIRNRNYSRPTDTMIFEGKKEIVMQWLKEAGMNYLDVTVEKFDEERGSRKAKVWLWKSQYNEEGEIAGKVRINLDRDESEGSKKFYTYIGLLHKLFEEGGIFISDEIDNNFHPSLLRKLISLFQNPTINKANAQLLFTSHDTNLMDHDFMRRDQFYFTEKALNEDTRLYSLSDLKGIRNNADFARQYLSGIYGAMPILGNYIEEGI